MAHLIFALFFSLVFLGAGAAAQAMVKACREEIAAALAGRAVVRPAPQGPVFTVTLRAPRLRADGPRLSAAA